MLMVAADISLLAAAAAASAFSLVFHYALRLITPCFAASLLATPPLLFMRVFLPYMPLTLTIATPTFAAAECLRFFAMLDEPFFIYAAHMLLFRALLADARQDYVMMLR